MSKQFEELSQPVGYVGKRDMKELSYGDCGYIKPNDAFGESPVYSQEYVTALLAALDVKTKAHAAAIEQMHFHEQRADAAERREDDLKAMFDVVSAKNAELEQRLQQPIPEILIDSVCHRAADIYYAKDGDQAQEIINRIREMLTDGKVEGE